jgi:hypothetical protein
MRFWLGVVLTASPVVFPSAARADEGGASSGWALASAGIIDVTGFIVGGTLLAQAHGDHMRDNAGWLTIESGFALAPVASHGVSGEWGRGALFAAAPLVALAVTAGLFQAQPGTVEGGTLPQQRWMWAMFGAGLFTSAVGVVDALWAPARTRKIALRPVVGSGQIGLQIGGAL